MFIHFDIPEPTELWVRDYLAPAPRSSWRCEKILGNSKSRDLLNYPVLSPPVILKKKISNVPGDISYCFCQRIRFFPCHFDRDVVEEVIMTWERRRSGVGQWRNLAARMGTGTGSVFLYWLQNSRLKLACVRTYDGPTKKWPVSFAVHRDQLTGNEVPRQLVEEKADCNFVID